LLCQTGTRTVYKVLSSPISVVAIGESIYYLLNQFSGVTIFFFFAIFLRVAALVHTGRLSVTCLKCVHPSVPVDVVLERCSLVTKMYIDMRELYL
jgi:hypothetical protein